MGATRPEPQRTCIGCREVAGKRSLVRIVRAAAGGVAVEPGGERLPGRGAYVHKNRACWEPALQGATIGKALRMSPDSGIIEGLRGQLETISDSGLEEA